MINIKISDGRGQQNSDKEVKNWRRADWSKMRSELGRVNWHRELKDLSMEEKWSRFKTKITDSVKRNVPTRKVNNRGRPVWMTREIMSAVRRKKLLWARVKGGVITEEYREADKAVKKMIRNAKRKFEKRLADGYNGNSRLSTPTSRRRRRVDRQLDPSRTRMQKW
jgi:hypothetical protein